MNVKPVFKVVTLVIAYVLHLLLLVMPLHAKADNLVSSEIWVSTDGDDRSEGTKEKPFATIHRALSHVRELRRMVSQDELGPVHVVLKGGTYRMDETLRLTADDSGTPTSPTIIQANEGEDVVLSGGIVVQGWSKAGDIKGLPTTAKGHIWKASAPVVNGEKLLFRQMWVGNSKMRRASTFDDLSMTRIISADKKKSELIIPRIEQTFAHPEQLEMIIIQDWVTNVMRVKSIQSVGNRSVLKFKEPESGIEFKRPWPILRADESSYSNHMFYLTNAIELLNQPQEWFCDSISGELYYWPRNGEETSTLEAVVPVLETLVSVSGEDGDWVENITFDGITFAHSSWLRPSLNGHVPLQAGQWLYDAYTDDASRAGNVAWVGRPSSAVSVNYARNISFEDCNFRQTASTAIDFVAGTKNMKVRGCTFSDIGGTAILAGYFGDKEFEAHEPYNPDNHNVVCDSIIIDNNYIAQPATEDWGCLGVCVGFASNVTISHNEIFDTPYSAISMGWGWTKDANCMHDNHIVANYIHSFCNQMRDGGAIYTLSSQPNSSIEGNRIENVGDPMFNPVMWDMRHSQFDLYLDEGSDYFTVRNNWCERGEISKNKNGNNNIWGKNNSSVSTIIKDVAGLELEYAYIKEKVTEGSYAPFDSIGDDYSAKKQIEYIASSEGFKLGNAIAIDINGDNRLDIAYAGGESNQVQHGGVRINMGNYDFCATQGLRRLYMSNFAAGDLNGDGCMDLIQSGWDFWSSCNILWLNDGNGRLIEQKMVSNKNASPACGIADVNNDGLNDFFFVGNGSDNDFYLQQKDRTFAAPMTKLKLPGGFSDPNMVYADFNNDQAVDICLLSNRTGGVFTRMFYNDGNGNFIETNVGIKEKGTRGGMAYADVNNDGWLDIVVGGLYYGEQWNSTMDKGGKVVTLYLNDHNGGFVKQQEFAEYMFDNVTQPVRFCDWNNDGHTDLILSGWNMSQGNISQTDIYLNDGTGFFEKSEIDLPGVSESSLELADFGRTGRCDILISGNCNAHYQNFTTDRRIAVLCRNQSESTNSIPQPPTNLKSETDRQGNIHLSWDAGSDKETNVNALSYNYYLRNVDTGQFLIFPNADIDTGCRWVSHMGNTWLNKRWMLRDLPTGNYAWSVQTIDAGYAGSVFAEEQFFTYTGDVGIDDVSYDKADIRLSVLENVLVAEVDMDQSLSVFLVDGSLVYKRLLRPGSNRIVLPKGIYIVNKEKVIIK